MGTDFIVEFLYFNAGVIKKLKITKVLIIHTLSMGNIDNPSSMSVRNINVRILLLQLKIFVRRVATSLKCSFKFLI